MRVVVRWASLVVVVAVVAAGRAWFTDVPPLEASDAIRVAAGALAAADVDVTVVGDPSLGVHRSDDGEEVDAWTVDLVVADDAPVGGGEEIEVKVQETAGQLVFVDDRIGPDDATRLLDDDQFATLADYRDDTLTDDWVLRNVVGSAAAAAVAVLGVSLAGPADRLRRKTS